jgi:RNA recognition motif-containing protein
MNIFVSNLSFRINDEDLRQLFEEYGEIKSAKVITDKFSGKSRGFGFVEMPDNDSAKKAIEELDRAEYDGKVIGVSEARPKTENRSNSGSRGGYGGGDRGGDRGGYGDRNRDRGGNSGKRW